MKVLDHMGAFGFNPFNFSDISGRCVPVGYLGS
jgi:hypothetical protein